MNFQRYKIFFFFLIIGILLCNNKILERNDIGTFSKKNGVVVLFPPSLKNLIILKLTKLFSRGNKITFRYTRAFRAFRKLNIF